MDSTTQSLHVSAWDRVVNKVNGKQNYVGLQNRVLIIVIIQANTFYEDKFAIQITFIKLHAT